MHAYIDTAYMHPLDFVLHHHVVSDLCSYPHSLVFACVCVCVCMRVCVCVYVFFSYGSGGSGSGGSILIEACNVSGVGTVSARGGSSRDGSGGGGGGRIAITAGLVTPQLVLSLSLCSYAM